MNNYYFNTRITLAMIIIYNNKNTGLCTILLRTKCHVISKISYQSKVVGTGAVHDGGPAVPCTHPLFAEGEPVPSYELNNTRCTRIKFIDYLILVWWERGYYGLSLFMNTCLGICWSPTYFSKLQEPFLHISV